MNAQISSRILEVMEINKCAVGEALDIVLGPGTFAKLASDLYDDLRKQAA